MTKPRGMAAIYADLEDAAADTEVDDLSDEEADRQLVRLEAAYERFLAGVYRTWPRARRYQFDRSSLIFQCWQQRHEIADCATGVEGLTQDEVVKHCEACAAKIKKHQAQMARLRLEFYAGQQSGAA